MGDPRYAIYFTPTDQKPLWSWGSSIIGYDALSGENLPAADVLGLSGVQWSDITREPRRYGFHATLKAPFRLNGQRSENELRAHFRSVVTAEKALVLDALQVVAMGPFIALTIQGETAGINRMAFRIVEAFENFRAPLNDSEIARRLRSPLNEQQRRNLDIYGYPHVGDEFKFHMTLTGSIADADLRSQVTETLAAGYQAVSANRALAVSMISLLKQPSPDQPFRILEQFRLQD